MTLARRRIGAHGERIARRRLRAAGYEIVARNVRTRDGEIDVVAAGPTTLVFVEVKTLRAGNGAGPERAAHAVDRRKQLRLRRLARAWLAEAERVPRRPSLRFDVIGIRIADSGEVLDYEHIEGAF